MKNFLLNAIFTLCNTTVRRIGVQQASYAMADGGGGGGSSSSGNNAGAISQKIQSILDEIVGPIMIAIGGVMVIYIVVLAVMYIKSENDNKRAEVKQRIINMVIGLIVIMILAVLCMAINWEALVSSLYNYF